MKAYKGIQFYNKTSHTISVAIIRIEWLHAPVQAHPALIAPPLI